MSAINVVAGFHAVKALLRVSPQKIEKLGLQKTREDGRIAEIAAMAKELNINVEHLTRQEIEDCAGLINHQGIIAIIHETLIYEESLLPTLIDAMAQPLLILILDSLQDPQNFGACLRSADAFGASLVIAPKDKAVGMTSTVRKVASGAAETVPFVQVTNLARTLRLLQEKEIWLVGTAADAETQLHDIDLSGNIGLVLGNESSGMRRLTREHCDFLATIPMQGTVDSLNVAVAAGICLYEANRQRLAGLKTQGDK